MAISDELIAFVKEAMARGLPKAEIERALAGAGWPQEQIRGALASFADAPFPIPVPVPRPYVSARDAFMYLVMFTTLYLSAFNLGQLIFELINRAFPDPAAPTYELTILHALRWSIASLIVAVPVFVYTSVLTARAVRIDPTKRSSRIRRQLTYLTLFIASCLLIGDVTTLIYSFLGGELTTRFLLKVLTIGAIGGTAFWYYLNDVRDDRDART
jgi:hypothetical protein